MRLGLVISLLLLPLGGAGAMEPVLGTGADEASMGSVGWLYTSDRILPWDVLLDPDTFQLDFGGKLHVDAADYHTPGNQTDEPADEIGVRRGRVSVRGRLPGKRPVRYKTEVEIADGRFYFREAFLTVSDLPSIQNIKAGHFKAPMTLEGLNSSGNRALMELPAPTEAFFPGIKFGVQPYGYWPKHRVGWAFGWFADGETNDIGEASTSLGRAIGRMTWAPLRDTSAGKNRALHLGTGGHYLYSSDNSVRYRSRPESYFAPRILDTGTIDADQGLTWAVEAAWIDGPLLLQSEWYRAHVFAQDAGDPVFWGGYVSAGWLLTGESRDYDPVKGLVSGVEPRKKFWTEGYGTGAWELALRGSILDLSDQGIEGGEMIGLSSGLNWYWTRSVRVMLDYGQYWVDDRESYDRLRVIQARWQWDF
jgi:phosphate-selective porin OprO/OprP